MRTVAVLLLSLSIATPAYAGGCKANEIKVDEDDDYVYCKDRDEYAACVRAAGERSRSPVAQRRCAGRVEQVARGFGYKLTSAGLTCLGSCGAAALTKNAVSTNSCFVSCGIAGTMSTELLDKSIEEMNGCFEEVLVQQKQDLQGCKR